VSRPPICALSTLGVLLAVATAAAQPQPDAGAPEPPPDTGPVPGEVTGPDGVVAPATAAPTAGVAGPIPEPPTIWTTWDVEAAPGTALLESKETVRAMLEPEMRTRTALTPQARNDIVDAARKIGYYVQRSREVRQRDGTIKVILVLQPLSVIRRIEIHLDQWSRLYVKEELTKRMHLRVGEILDVDPEKRAEALEEERVRLTEFLQDEGFFETRLMIRPEHTGSYGEVLHVDAALGPDYYVGKITIDPKGPLAFSRAEIRRVFDHCRLPLFGKCRWEQRFTRAQHQADIQRLTEMYQRRGYPAARVRSDFNRRQSFDRGSKSVDFTVRIDERRRLAVEFEGNDPKKFPDDELTAQLTFDDSASADDLEIAASALAIQHHYQRNGWFDAAVSWERDRKRIDNTGGDSSFDLIRYRIDAGQQRMLRGVELVGVHALSEDDVRAVMLTRASSVSFRLLGGGSTPVTTEQLEADAARIADLYHGRGYLAATVQVTASPAPETLDDAATTAALLAADRRTTDLYVRFAIREGERTEVGKVDLLFEGPHTATREQVLEQLGVRAGDPFIAADLQAARARIESWYWKLGRPRAQVKLDFDQRDPRRVTATYTVEERQELRVGKVIVRGNFRTARWVILDELGFEEGALLTDELYARGKRRLRATGLFSAVKIDLINFDETREDRINVAVWVEERNDVKANIDLEGGYSDQKSAYIKGAPTFPNPFGNGISISSGVTFGADVLELRRAFEAEELAIRFPRWWVARGIGLAPDIELSGFRRVQDTERFGELTTYNATIAASRGWSRSGVKGKDDRALSATLRFDFRVRNREEDSVRVAGNNGNVESTRVTNRASVVGVDLAWDQRVDARGNLNPLSPDHGFKLQASVGLAARIKYLGQDNFLKLSGIGQWTHPVGRRVQLRIEGRYDHGIPLGGAVLLPEVERYFAGGDETVRGFDEDRLAVEVIEEQVPPFAGVTQVDVLPAGGNIRMLGTVDFQVRLWQIGSLPVASALYVDAGVITNGLSAIDPEDVRPSVGVALARLLTPFGGLSLEWAIPMLPRELDPPLGRLHFLVALRY